MDEAGWSGDRVNIGQNHIQFFPHTCRNRLIFIGIAIAIVIAYFLTILSAYRYHLERQDYIGIVIGTPKKLLVTALAAKLASQTNLTLFVFQDLGPFCAGKLAKSNLNLLVFQHSEIFAQNASLDIQRTKS